jgi:hypothetical protein
MKRSALKRPTDQGFLSLIPDPEHADASGFIEELLSRARDAHDHAHHARTLMLEAVWFEHQGFQERARALRSASQCDHHRACSALFDLAMIARDLVRWSSVDWLPTVDVVGSGLTDDELNALCAVYGMPVDAIEEESSATR